MSLALTAIAGLIIVLLGLIGLWRDVQRGFLSLFGTLLGVVLVQIWAAPLATWLQKTLGWAQSTASWTASSFTFLLVVVFVGYGIGSFIPKPKPLAKDDPARLRPKVLSRPAGALLGALNGALIASVLLLYAQAWRANETLQGAITDSYILKMLIDWFAWFILGVAVVIGVQACFKWLFGIVTILGRFGAARQQPQAAQTAQAASKASGIPLTAEEKKIEAQNEAAHRARLERVADKLSRAANKSSSEK